jgi:hypothetical protein
MTRKGIQTWGGWLDQVHNKRNNQKMIHKKQPINSFDSSGGGGGGHNLIRYVTKNTTKKMYL